MSTLCEHIVNVLPELTKPVFVGDMPSVSTEGVAISQYDGNANTEYLGMSTTVFAPIIKVYVRTIDYKEGDSIVQQIKGTLHRRVDDVMMSCLLVGSPMYLGRGPEKLHEFQLTFNISVEEG